MASVIVPALSEPANIEHVIASAKGSSYVSEIIVVDDGSLGEMPAAAAGVEIRLITSTLLGKGASMEDGFRESRSDVVVFLDGDLRGLVPDAIDRLVAPIVEHRADFVKGRCSGSGSRVTTLTAKPLIETFFPELAHFSQPLGGIIAARRTLLEGLRFETDCGAGLGLLIDAHFADAVLMEADVGRDDLSQSLEDMGEMAKQVVHTLLKRANQHGRLSLRQLEEVEEVDRQASAEFAIVLSGIGQAGKLALFDMDGTLLQDRFVLALARRTGLMDRLLEYIDNPRFTAHERGRRIAECFKGVSHDLFIEVAKSIPLTEGAVETVIALRKEGFRVGIVSDSFRIVTEIVRRRVFADFSVANLTRFRDGQATGDFSLSPLFVHRQGCAKHESCKCNVLLHLEEKLAIPASHVVAVGDSTNDVCLLRHAGIGIAFDPKTADIRQVAAQEFYGDLRQILDICAFGEPLTTRVSYAGTNASV